MKLFSVAITPPCESNLIFLCQQHETHLHDVLLLSSLATLKTNTEQLNSEQKQS